MNLCLNARDAMPEGGDIRVEIDYPPPASAEEDRQARIVVADTGLGMDPATAAQIFEPFFTTKGTGKGTGLGLSMVWGFVRQSRGTIDVESAPGAGTRFTICLPAAPEAPEETRRTDTPAAGRGLVLVVDDNHDLRQTLCRQLTRLGYSVLDAESGEEALDLVEGVGELRALISDVVMPGMSGFMLARTAQRLRPDLRIVLMTGYDGADQADREGLALPVLAKPFDPRALVRAIETGGETNGAA